MSDDNLSRIGPSMVITGDVVCENPVILEGKIEGSFTGRDLDIRECGQLVGEVRGGAIQCFGHMEGHIVTTSLCLHHTGCQVGTVETHELEVRPGAVLDCALQSGTPKPSRPSPRRPKAPRVQRPEPEEVKIEIGGLVTAFQERSRPCCMDVPWSERLELFSHLLELLEKDKPLVKVTGESGSGKSVLAEKLKNSLPDSFGTLQVTDQVGSVSALLQGVAADLNIDDAVGIASPQDLLALIKPVLGERRKCGQRVVLLVDDAQEMYPATMEGITRLLTSAYRDEDNTLQMILLGTREMEAKMVATTLEYFEDETNCQLYLDPLNLKDTADYLRFCLQLASGGDDAQSVSILPNETIKAIHVRSRGNIAEINSLADKALRSANAAGASSMKSSFVS